MQYKLIETDSGSELTRRVNKCLKRGWKLYGPPSCSIAKDTYLTKSLYCQAVIKQEEYNEQRIINDDNR